MDFLLASIIPWGAYAFWDHLEVDEEGKRFHRWFLSWTLKGLVLPAVAWILNVLGVLPAIPFPNMAAFGASWWQNFASQLALAGPGLLALSTFWLAVTFIEYYLRLVWRLPDGRELLIYAGLWLLLTSPFTALILYGYRWAGAGAALGIWLVPQIMQLANCIPPRTIIPMYSKAVAMMKRGKYADAEWAVIQELEKCEDDYTGWMMLAELYATKFNDIPAAVQTISDLCEQPGTSPTQAAMALHRLADWQLQLAQDPGAARIVLGEISRKYPGTHLAFMAEQRRQQLPATREALLEQQQAKKIAVPSSQAIYTQAAQPHRPDLSADEAAELANQYSQRLTANPNDVPTREAFARLMAENLGQPAVGVEQLDLLLALPTPADSQKAAWLLLQAAWQLEGLNDRATGEKTLRRLVKEFPKSPQAFSAQRKLSRLEVEDRYRQMRLTGGIRLPDLPEGLTPPGSAAAPATAAASAALAEAPKIRE